MSNSNSAIAKALAASEAEQRRIRAEIDRRLAALTVKQSKPK